MMGSLVVRPEPGNARTLARLRAAGGDALGWPLFAVEPVEWAPPDPATFDSLLVTSAQAIRHAGPQLRMLAMMPVIAVGQATASVARAAGLQVSITGTRDVAAVLTTAAEAGLVRPLHLAGRDHVATGSPTAIVYDSVALPVDAAAFAAAAAGRLVLLHSARAARRVAALIPQGERHDVSIVALSPAVACAAGSGWRAVAAAAQPVDATLVALAQSIDRAAGGGDKTL
ncbi:uroporphyrinogen-III synthase [Sphingomonas beigongshangi]|uniref:uroporphyrinogen-III synthase n=1 Tax=Sphingomonas beigongshangi TaxID=2782540 RepID=UPI001AEED66B|nr:uroporphyrinogen-III synthase [Sphingomonas beigongshangi]